MIFLQPTWIIAFVCAFARERVGLDQALHESFVQSCRAAMWVSGVLALLSDLTAWLTVGGKPSRTQLTWPSL